MNESYRPVSPLVSPYAHPEVYPKVGDHPRVYLTKRTLPRVKAALSHPDHANYQKEFLALAHSDVDTDAESIDFNSRTLLIIECKALYALLFDDAPLARKSIDLIFYVLRHISISDRMDVCRAYGAVMHTSACVYDWLYPHLSSAEREEIVSRCEYELGPHFEVGFPPDQQGMVTGHGSEAQMFRDWLSFAIATYDEYPDIYEYVTGRITEQAVPPRNFYYRSRTHWQGSTYGPYRHMMDLYCALLLNVMSDGEYHIFDPIMHEAAISFLCNIRADGEPFRDGDDCDDKGQSYHLSSYHTVAFFSSALYRDPLLRDHVLSLPYGPSVAAHIFLLLDDPSVGRLDVKANLPRIRYVGSPRGQYTAHTADGASVFFKVGEAYSANHEHKDSGQFMIYYKGSLASAANCYQYDSASGVSHMYGSPLDLRFNKQTVAHNCMLVFDPDEKVDPKWGNSGGQKTAPPYNWENFGMKDWIARGTTTWAKVLAHADATNAAGYLDYCMLCGDLSNAYSDKIKSYRRTSLAVGGEGDRRLLVFIFDDLKTRDPLAEKTWQMHTMGKFTLEEDRAIVRSDKGGCLVCQTLLPSAVKREIIGSESERFVLNGENLADNCDPVKEPICEDGRDRLAVSPASPCADEYFLHAMYVTDDGLPIDTHATLVSGDGFVCAALDGVLALFPTSPEPLEKISLSLSSETRLYLTNLLPGTWTDGVSRYEVTESGRMLVLTASGDLVLRRV